MSDHHGKVWWNELVTSDLEKSREHYTSLMGWDTMPMPMPDGEYLIFKRGEEFVAGAFVKSDEMGPVPDHWMTYLAVDDVDASVQQSVSMGGSVVRAPFDIPGTGRIALVQDTTGATVGLMTPSDA